MRTFIFIPPVRQATGGVSVLRALGAHLRSGGFEAVLVLREEGLRPSGLAADVPLLAWKDLDLRPEDIWLAPEGWANALAPGLKAGARCLVYCQNQAYLFSSLPPGVDWRGLPVGLLAVSRPVAMFIRETLGLEAPVLRPGIDLGLFRAPESKPPVSPGHPLRIACMPRKNKAVLDRVREAFAARTAGRVQFEWLPIAGLDARGVAETLRSAHVFLATGFPEGLGLPPLEAMACGCLPVGCGGFGGFDYMRQAADIPGAYRPWFPLREVPWGGNGLWCADGDVLAAVLALETAAGWWLSGDPRLRAALDAGQATARAYSLERQREAVLALWTTLRTKS